MDLSAPRKPDISLPLLYRYFGAAAFIAFTTVFRLALMPLIGVGGAFTVYFGSTVIITYLFGRGPGFMSGILGAIAGTTLFMNTAALSLAQMSAHGLLFLLEAVCVAVVTHGFTRSRRITELQAQALLHSESHYRVLTDVSPQATWEADIRGNITFTNLYWQNYSGLTATQSLGRGYLLAIELKERSRARAFMRLKMRMGDSFQTEVRLMRAEDNQLRWHLLRGRPVIDERGRIHKWVGVAVDIEQQKRAAHQLEDAVRAKDNFLSAASHELKTPLTSMQLMMQMMRRNWLRGRNDAYTPEKLTRLFGQIDKSVRRLTLIIDDMLDVSRISNNKMALNLVTADLRHVLDEVMERLAGQIEASCVHVTVHCSQPIIGRWDTFRLEQVLTNLLINAIRYGQGSNIELKAEQQGHEVRLSVRDYGPGVAKSMQRVIFEQFEQGIAANPSGGLGLGLFLCREIVERHGGQIGCVQPDGKGAQFDVHLPLIVGERQVATGSS